ncbi:Helix-turn-helix domain [Mycolicibacterium aurum]|uniref:Helix-turn-helix domain n=1 Tax=Mycolicibacterium aurum TaxID=1791 RepID=A0A448ITA5_MYCAU|nr:helix-turn-helix domain-containing protein [Mycolicibacterium aurum]VEG55658.1 Helix-turn-helix domain [Mycolicibacterium aurum]
MDNTPDDRLLVPIPETCGRLGGISRTMMYELIDRGELVKVNIGRRGFITAKSIAAYVERLTAAATAS